MTDARMPFLVGCAIVWLLMWAAAACIYAGARLAVWLLVHKASRRDWRAFVRYVGGERARK